MRDDAVSDLRAVFEGEELIVHRFPEGFGLASADGVSRWAESRENLGRCSSLWERIKSRFQPTPYDPAYLHEVWVPQGAYLIVKGIRGSIRQRYGLAEEEGAVMLRFGAAGESPGSAVQFNNGVELGLRDLREGQRIEILSLALVVDKTLYSLCTVPAR